MLWYTPFMDLCEEAIKGAAGKMSVEHGSDPYKTVPSLLAAHA
jgi:hypothetical protein